MARTSFVVVRPGTVVDLKRKLRLSRGRFEFTESVDNFGSQFVRAEYDPLLSTDRLLVPLSQEERAQFSQLGGQTPCLTPFVSHLNQDLFSFYVNIRFAPEALDIILVSVKDDLDTEAAILQGAPVVGDVESASVVVADLIYGLGDPALWEELYCGSPHYSVVRLFVKKTIASAVGYDKQVINDEDGLVMIYERRRS